MKTYLVGGAVRDKLLNRPVKERDWVVVGGTPEQLLSQGFKQVGRDFPVFLHPLTREEYALARLERKTGSGYLGFACEFSPDVTLEEDLGRRDLTINAMAMDDKGNLIDPYNGLEDLKNKYLRHVTSAFAEDPVRILRVARFAARYHHLGFTLATQTKALMIKMVQSKELDSLVPERVWQEFEKSLHEQNPEIFIEILRSVGALQIIMPELNDLFGVPFTYQINNSNLIIDAGLRSLHILQNAAKLSKNCEIRFAALLYNLNVGKLPVDTWPLQQQNIRPNQKIIKTFCARLRIPVSFQHLSLLVMELNVLISQLFSLDAEEIVAIFNRADAFRRPQMFENLLIVSQAIYHDKNSTKIFKKWRELLKKCTTLQAQEIIAQGYEGKDISIELHNKRVFYVNQELKNER